MTSIYTGSPRKEVMERFEIEQVGKMHLNLQVASRELTINKTLLMHVIPLFISLQ